MSFNVQLHRLALKEFRQARNRYRLNDPSVAERFTAAVDRALDRVAADPESFPLHRQDYRCVRIRRFPYVAYFRSAGERSLMVVALAHTSRRPDYWIRRQIEMN